MSAITIIRQSNRVHMISDGAIYGPPGFVSHPSIKIWPLPHLSAAFALRGPALLSPLLASVLAGAAATYDDLKTNAVDAVRAHLRTFIEILRDHPQPDIFDFFVAGLSETTGPDSYFVYSHDRFSEPWTIHDCGAVYIAPMTPAMEPEIRAVLGVRQSLDDIDPIADGMRIIHAQRKHWASVVATEPPDSPFRYGRSNPSGFIQMATVSNGGIGTGIIHRWAD